MKSALIGRFVRVGSSCRLGLQGATVTGLSLLVFACISQGLAAADAKAPGTFDIRDYGARGQGSEPDTAAMNRAIAACAEAGGGQVRVPPGRYLSGTIRLQSRVTLFLEAGAVLVGTTNLDAYDHFRPPEGTPEFRFRPQWHRALILAEGATNIAVMGPGRIDGNRVFDPRGEERMRGPHTILMGHCRDVILRDFSVVDSANYAIMMEDCSRVEVRGLRVEGGWDGVHFRGWPGIPCRGIQIVDCQFYTGDDAIAGRYWEDVLITGCVINSSCNGIRLIGPATRLIVNDCLFYGPGVYPHRTSNRHNMLAGLALQPGAWDATEGVLDDVLLSNNTMRHVTTPLHLSLKKGNTLGTVVVNQLQASGLYRAALSVESWTDGPLTNVVLRDVTLEFTGGGKAESSSQPVQAPGVDARPLPAWGFYARNVANLTLDQVRLRLAQDDFRPALICEDVRRLNLLDLQFDPVESVTDPVRLHRVDQIRQNTDL